MNEQKLTKEQKKEIWITIRFWGAALISAAILENIVYMIGFAHGCDATAKESINLIKTSSPEVYNLLFEALNNKNK